MALKPMQETLSKNAGPDFNEKAAKAAYEMVMKMDEDSAREFTTIVVSDMLEDLIEKNLPVFQKRLNQVVEQRVSKLKKATLASVSKGDSEQAKGFAEALSLVEKALNPYDHGYIWREQDFNRDPGSGRFRAKVRTSGGNPIKGRQAKAMGIPEHKYAANMDDEDKARFQQEYLQLAQFLGTVNSSTRNPGDAEVLLHLRGKNGQQYTVKQTGTRPNEELWNPSTEKLESMEFRPATLTVGGAAFGLTSALGASGQTSRSAAEGMRNVDSKFDGFASDWNKTGFDPNRPNDRRYQQLNAGSKFLADIAPAGSKVQMAAAFGQFIGSHGPQAEEVFGPAARKAAYRYRGTERRPDSKLVQEYGSAVNRSMASVGQVQDDRAQIRAARTRAINAERARRADAEGKPIEAITISPQDRVKILNQVTERFRGTQQARSGAPTWEEREAGRRKVVEYLDSEGIRPRKGLYNLQLASGNTPPSEGVVLDDKGQIALQAVGYGDDHYLPFNLKNLKALKNGEYIRNRSVGGPTSEDIYTGLMTGARQITVVSRSGTFTVKFKDDFRGGRRHNDKAKRMVRRYERILDAVQSKQVDRLDVTPEVRRAITQEVKEEAGGFMSRQEFHDEVQRRIDDFKANPEISEEDDKIAELIIAARTAGGTTKDASEIRRSVYTDIAEQKEYKFRLNGEGYRAALVALQEQFPYYIEVDSIVAKPEAAIELESDRGYVAPSRNRPTAARGNFYDHRAPGGNLKQVSAADVDYQGSRTARVTGQPVTPEEEGKKKEEEAKNGGKSAERVLAEMDTKKKFVDAAWGMKVAMNSAMERPTNAEVLKWWGMDEGQFRKAIENRDTVTSVRQFIKQNEGALEQHTVTQGPLTAFLAASGAYDRVPYTPELAESWNPEPFSFPGDAYAPGASAMDRRKEMEKIKAGRHGVMTNKPLTAMTDTELQAEILGVGELRRKLNALDSDAPFEIKRKVLSRFDQTSPTLRAVASDDRAREEFLETTQKVRTLQHGIPDDQREQFDNTVHNEPKSREELAKFAKRVAENSRQAASLAKWARETANDPALAKDLSELADKWDEDSYDINTETDFDNWYSENKVNVQRLSDLMARQRQERP